MKDIFSKIFKFMDSKTVVIILNVYVGLIPQTYEIMKYNYF